LYYTRLIATPTRLSALLYFSGAMPAFSPPWQGYARLIIISHNYTRLYPSPFPYTVSVLYGYVLPRYSVTDTTRQDTEKVRDETEDIVAWEAPL